jgi:hypothetical protein
MLLDEPWPVWAGCCGMYFFCSFPRFSQCLWRRQWQGGDPWRAMGGYAPLAAPLAVAPQALHCAFQEQKKCRGKRQPLAAARARPQRKIPPWSVPASRPGAVAATEARPQQHTAPSKRPIDQRSAAAWQGSGGASPPGHAPAHASSTRHERAPFPLHAQCLLPASTDGQDRTPPRRCDRVADHQELASPCVGASSSEVQPRLMPRRQAEAGAPRRIGANRHGGRRCRPRWSWKPS